MDCCSSLAKLFLVLLNLLFLVLGLVLLIVGGIGLAGDDTIQSGFQQGLNAAGASNTTLPYAKEAMKSMAELLKKAAIPVLVAGFIICVIAISGMFGVCCKSRGLLITYMVALFIILTGEIVFIALYMNGSLDSKLKHSLKASIKEDYVSMDSSQPTSAAWTLIMTGFQCCGVDGYLDFNGTKQWKSEREFNITRGNQTITRKVNLLTPLACCKMNKDKTGFIDAKTCAISPMKTTSNYRKGCYETFKDQLGNYVVAFAFCILLLQVFLIGLVGFLIHNMDKDEKYV